MFKYILLAILFVTVYGEHKDSYHNKVICEHKGAKEIGCEKGQVMMIMGANYGRLTVKYCAWHNNLRTNCRADRSDLKIKRMCNGKQKCKINPTNVEFSDPCKGIQKYVSVRYLCTSKMPSTKRAVVCEDSAPKDIDCGGKKINIVGGNFGRLSVKYCRTGNFRRTNCRSIKSSQQMRIVCNGRNKCKINPRVSVFGEPCAKITKYASIEYQCY